MKNELTFFDETFSEFVAGTVHMGFVDVPAYCVQPGRLGHLPGRTDTVAWQPAGQGISADSRGRLRRLQVRLDPLRFFHVTAIFINQRSVSLWSFTYYVTPSLTQVTDIYVSAIYSSANLRTVH